MRNVFIRNDDVREELSDSLRYITESILQEGYCISHAVEPANATQKVVDWLLQMMEEYPGQLELIQHGYDHKVKTDRPMGEFGGQRVFDDQLEDISNGRDIMNQWFGDKWFPAFSFPFGTYNRDTLLALDSLGYSVITTGMNLGWKRRLINFLGYISRRKHIGRYNIVYCGDTPPGFSFREYPVVLNTTKTYLKPDGGIQKNRDELIEDWNGLKNFDVLGILTHHRFNSKDDTDHFLRFLKTIGNTGEINFSTIRSIYEK